MTDDLTRIEPYDRRGDCDVMRVTRYNAGTEDVTYTVRCHRCFDAGAVPNVVEGVDVDLAYDVAHEHNAGHDFDHGPTA